MADKHEGVNGFFGCVNALTHSHYENRPSPSVSAFRIGRDIATSIIRNIDVNWNLFVALRPEKEDAGEPTANLFFFFFPTRADP